MTDRRGEGEGWRPVPRHDPSTDGRPKISRILPPVLRTDSDGYGIFCFGNLGTVVNFGNFGIVENGCLCLPFFELLEFLRGLAAFGSFWKSPHVHAALLPGPNLSLSLDLRLHSALFLVLILVPLLLFVVVLF